MINMDYDNPTFIFVSIIAVIVIAILIPFLNPAQETITGRLLSSYGDNFALTRTENYTSNYLPQDYHFIYYFNGSEWEEDSPECYINSYCNAFYVDNSELTFNLSDDNFAENYLHSGLIPLNPTLKNNITLKFLVNAQNITNISEMSGGNQYRQFSALQFYLADSGLNASSGCVGDKYDNINFSATTVLGFVINGSDYPNFIPYLNSFGSSSEMCDFTNFYFIPTDYNPDEIPNVAGVDKGNGWYEFSVYSPYPIPQTSTGLVILFYGGAGGVLDGFYKVK